MKVDEDWTEREAMLALLKREATDLRAELERVKGQRDRLVEALASERERACECDFMIEDKDCAACERIGAAIKEVSGE